MKWEICGNGISRFRVEGGWIVVLTIINKRKLLGIFNRYDRSLHTVFVPDATHCWKLEAIQ